MEVKMLAIPRTCPACGQPTTVYQDPNSGVLTLYCGNPNCPAKGNRILEHFVARDAMNIEGISSSTLNTFVEMGFITDFVSIFHLDRYAEEITYLPGFGVKSYNNILAAVDKARNVKISNLIYALGIPNIGLATAKLICKSFNYDVVRILNAEYNELAEIPGIGGVVASNFVEYFADPVNQREVTALLKEVNIQPEKQDVDASMSGLTFCVTGDVYIFPNRRAVKDYIESHGGKLTGSVSRSTSYLITNDTTSGSNKNKAAQKYGIPILSEQDFIKKFNIKF